MDITVIKFFGIILNCLYAYIKVLNICDIPKSKIMAALIFSGTMAVVMSFLRLYIPNARLIIMLLSIYAFIGLTMSDSKYRMTIAILISTGIGYGFSSMASITSAFIMRLLSGTVNMTLLSILTTIAGITLTYSLFRVKRLRKGFVFLQNKESWNISIIVSGIIVIAVSMIGIKAIPNIVAFLLLVVAVSCSFLLFIWWRYCINKLYHQKLTENSMQEYKDIITEKDKEIQKICESNDYLSNVIHRDNKLIPSMYYAVRDFLEASSKTTDIETQIKGERILNELEEVMKERIEMILKNQRDYKTLPSTKVELIDNTLNYMLLKASKNNIIFDFVVTVSVRHMTEDVIPKQSLNTLIADLVENAIISTDCSAFKKILVTIGVVDGCYEINIHDSGMTFTEETLDNLGLKKITTHGDTGGSGIGYMTIFEILYKNNASLIITEYAPDTYAFSKSVKIRFDGKPEYIVYSFRSEKLKMAIKRTDILIYGYPLRNRETQVS